MAKDVQDRFVFNLTESQSIMTILRSRRSDSGKYQLRLNPVDLNVRFIEDEVKISVKCEWKFFSLIFIERLAALYTSGV